MFHQICLHEAKNAEIRLRFDIFILNKLLNVLILMTARLFALAYAFPGTVSAGIRNRCEFFVRNHALTIQRAKFHGKTKHTKYVVDLFIRKFTFIQ